MKKYLLLGEYLMKSLFLKFRYVLILALSVQLISCGTILYPERRNQRAGFIDAGVVVLDAVGLLFGIIPGVIAFAVDFSTGAIYFPTVKVERERVSFNTQDLRIVKFDPKHYTLASLEAIISKETGKDFHFSDQRLRLVKLKDQRDILVLFAQFQQTVLTRTSLALAK